MIRPVGRFVSACGRSVSTATGSIPSDRRSVFARLLINLVVEVCMDKIQLMKEKIKLLNEAAKAY